ncbi:MAG: hypothetical protein IKN14_04315 [Clostridiales bacterium]|nr:hypothetical protein [Clostridiales bacterium]
MSSRGAYTKNGHATTDEYTSTGYVLDPNAKILVGNNGRHGLPDYSHTPNRIYIKLSHDNTLRELRQYDENGHLVLEIAYHSEKSLDKDLSKRVLHYHTYDQDLNRSPAILLTKDDPIYKKYYKYLKELGL